MQAAAVPRSEAHRLDALRAYQPFDTSPEAAFDDLTALAARVCDAPMAAISLVDAERIWFRSSFGWPVHTLSRDASFCAHAILEPGGFVVPDAGLDARFADNPLVTGETHVRFYAGVPLTTTDGHALGVLSVMDRVPRSLSPPQGDTLRLIGRHAMVLLDLRRQIRDLAESEARLIDVSMTSSPIRDASGRVVGVSKVARDITARTMAQAALRVSEAKYRRLFDCAPDGIVIADPDGRCLDGNPSVCRMLGYSRDELLALRTSDIVVPSEVLELQPARRILEEQATYEREWQLRRKDGSVFPAAVMAARMPDGNLLAMLRDVGDRNRAVEALRQAEERMRFALRNANVGIWDMDYRTGVLEWSETLEAQYGLAPRTFPGTLDSFIERVHPDDRARLLETIGTGARAGADFTIEHRVIWPDGAIRWLSGAGRVVPGEQGQPIRGVGISIDVTERHILEAQYQQAQKMEAVGRLAGGVAHDFNNLLTAILGYCELLLGKLEPGSALAADVAEIHQAGTAAAGLTRQLLTFSRRQIIEPALLDLNVAVADIRRMIGRLIGEDIILTVVATPEPAYVMADRGQMEQVIVNLAVNARDAMPTGGRLTIETAHLVLDDDTAPAHFPVAPGRYVALTVTDTGTGMNPDVQSHLFEPFFTTKESGKGTGLGLATVHGIVTRSGGSIGVYSEAGAGTTFRVYLPQADAAASSSKGVRG